MQLTSIKYADIFFFKQKLVSIFCVRIGELAIFAIHVSVTRTIFSISGDVCLEFLTLEWTRYVITTVHIENSTQQGAVLMHYKVTSRKIVLISILLHLTFLIAWLLCYPSVYETILTDKSNSSALTQILDENRLFRAPFRQSAFAWSTLLSFATGNKFFRCRKVGSGVLSIGNASSFEWISDIAVGSAQIHVHELKRRFLEMLVLFACDSTFNRQFWVGKNW